MSRFVEAFKEKNNTLMSLRINDDKLLQYYKNICTNIEDLKNIDLKALPVHGNRYTKSKIETYGD